MSFNEKTHNNILNGRISIIQPKKGFRFGSDLVFLASFVNTFLENKKNRNFLIADVGSGIGTVSLIIAFRNSNTNILAIDNKKQYLMLAEENIKINGFQDKIKTINNDIFNLDNNLKNSFDVVVSNPPFYKRENNKSNNKLEDSSKRIVNLKEWLENSLKLLKDKGIIFLITSTDILDDIINHLSEKAGSFKIFPFWPDSKKPSKRVIIFAKKGGNGPTELMPGLILYNQQGELTKKAKLPSEIGIFNLYKQFI